MLEEGRIAPPAGRLVADVMRRKYQPAAGSGTLIDHSLHSAKVLRLFKEVSGYSARVDDSCVVSLSSTPSAGKMPGGAALRIQSWG